MLGRHCIRSFSTSRKINSSFLSQLRQSRHGPLRWYVHIDSDPPGFFSSGEANADYSTCTRRLRISVLLCTSAAVVNICAKKFWDRRSLRNVIAEKDLAETQVRNNALLDAYGDRSSLEELEKARQWYEKRNS
ncbi:hypothetical protein E4U19_007664 [Claviceps sp. Clav32 group G5]|nr:hypothetical protein E4U19_007664 [Claviceps sp. Clav32 group G5]KAG6019804.1 hypothetical protein E4U40_006657 [Claviceps sp. LM458 group G5]KAG6043768.1 hypothetical protein E4U39_004154 [Claviceps sp. Clav50 group G5]